MLSVTNKSSREPLNLRFPSAHPAQLYHTLSLWTLTISIPIMNTKGQKRRDSEKNERD